MKSKTNKWYVNKWGQRTQKFWPKAKDWFMNAIYASPFRCGCSFPKSDRWYCSACKKVHIWDSKTWSDICDNSCHYPGKKK